MIEINIPAVPVSQPRQRHRVVHAKGKVFSQNYTPAKSPIADFKATVRYAASRVVLGPPLRGPLRVDVCFVFPRPSKYVWKKKAMPRIPHPKKPDRDNCDKAVLDALKGLVWVDDCQACQGFIEKWIAAGDEQPHVLVKVSEL